ncbi:hypothetical protein SISNIDRAFT_492110 [Sistotremastrum niveocremeum HHB9708]|uniref:Uncharacterized protein n=1 Tax=Sistotremastrum niveocremeum HHB9708 TaxID=1314777 RepID=A0A164M2C7_9AGAM|nr:hypothetical protein SISNIDRAFT_492110 [Sistotremastrum niveocremeum HHB9708]
MSSARKSKNATKSGEKKTDKSHGRESKADATNVEVIDDESEEIQTSVKGSKRKRVPSRDLDKQRQATRSRQTTSRDDPSVSVPTRRSKRGHVSDDEPPPKPETRSRKVNQPAEGPDRYGSS